MVTNKELKQFKINIPRKAVKFVLFQRTQYLFFRRNVVVQKIITFLPKRIAWALESLFSYFNSTVSIEAMLTKKKVENLFSMEMNNEYESMKQYLPVNANSILDIGCGVAGIDIFLSKHYESPSIYLLDKTEMPNKVYYGLTNKGCYYNSLDVAKKLLESNGVKSENIYLEEATDNKINFNNKFDLVVSLISWGFHYPVSTYLDEVYEKLNDKGVLVIDIRKKSEVDGVEEIRKKFGNVGVVYESSGNTRIVAVK